MSMDSWMSLDDVLKRYPLKEALHLCKEGRFDVLYQPMGNNPFDMIRPLAGLSSKRLIPAENIPVNSPTSVNNKAFLPMHPHVTYAEVILPETFYEQFGRDFKLFHYEGPTASQLGNVWILDLQKLFSLFYPEKGKGALTSEMVEHFKNSLIHTETGGEGISLPVIEIKSFPLLPGDGNQADMVAERIKYTNELIISLPNPSDKNKLHVQVSRYIPNINDLEYVVNCNQKQPNIVPSSFAYSQTAKEKGLDEILELSPTENTERIIEDIELLSHEVLDEVINILNNCEIQGSTNSDLILKFLPQLNGSPFVSSDDSPVSWADDTQPFIFDPDGFAKRFFYFNLAKGNEVFHKIMQYLRFRETKYRTSCGVELFDKIINISKFYQHSELDNVNVGWRRKKSGPGKTVAPKTFESLQKILDKVRDDDSRNNDLTEDDLTLFIYALSDKTGLQLLSQFEQYILMEVHGDIARKSFTDLIKAYGKKRGSISRTYGMQLDRKGIKAKYKELYHHTA